MPAPSRSFPPRFVWGVAAAAPQIEGAATAAGKGESVWDRLAKRPGCGYDDDAPDANGEVLDLHRREFARAYLRELQRGIADGAPVKGYFHWSFMDNFEWEDDYKRRFGLTHVDYKTQRRTPKLSAYYYSEISRSNRVV